MKLKKLSYFLIDIACVLISVLGAVMLRFDFQIANSYYGQMLLFGVASMLITSYLGFALGAYSSIFTYFGLNEMIRQFAISILSGFIFLIIKMLDFMNISGSITIIYCILYFAFSCAIKGYTRFEHWILKKVLAKSKDSKRILIIGAGQAGAMVVNQIINGKENLFPVGILDDDESKHNKLISGIKIYGSIDNTSYYAKKLDVQEILIVLPSANKDQIKDVFDKVSNCGLPTKIFQSVRDVIKYQEGDRDVIKDISIEDLLFRDAIKAGNSGELVKNKIVLVTGGAGSIGSELCRQILQGDCKRLIIYDINENALFEINEELKYLYEDKYILKLGSVREADRLGRVFEEFKPQVVFHAAAHKHVPMMEINPFEAVKNNVIGTLNMVELARKNKVKKFILISTDKAVNPTNVMGATKRICELLVKSYSTKETEMVAVRFGNVLGSNGSVIPLFKKQIERGGPVTVTDMNMTRYFMTIPEAVSLVLSAGSFAKGSELFVLDMGKPVKIYDLAINFIRLSGKVPFVDIDVNIIGLRKGEKLYEELVLDNETVTKTKNSKIFVMRDNGIDKERVAKYINILIELVKEENNEEKLKEVLFEMIEEKR